MSSGKAGAVAAFYMALAYLVGMLLFIVVLDYPSLTDSAQKIMLIEKRDGLICFTNYLLYILFGIALIVFTASLSKRLNPTSSSVSKTGLTIGIVWAGMLIASGLIANAGIKPIVKLHHQNSAEASLLMVQIEAISNALGGADGELLGGLFTLLLSLSFRRMNLASPGLARFGCVLGCVGILSIVPALNMLVLLFGVLQMVWFVWVGKGLLEEKEC